MTALIVLAAIAFLVLLVLSQTVKVIQQGYIGAVKRLGQYKALREPGLAMILPFVDNLTRVDIRETPRTGDRQEVITRDNVTVAVNATIFSQVVDA
ncbi:MAG TPA: SPFH domain-containing protein, partial [Candidatus Dormibacteraeota bacterium]|nr:SPFH domain-containing protein [Candidatus Dormibacteraeota bacterium]